LIILPIGMAVFAGLSRVHDPTPPTTAPSVASIDGSATVAVAPGRADAENTFIVEGIQAGTVRILSRSLDMNMGVIAYPASPLGHGQWKIINVEVPMVGRWSVGVQAWRDSAWVTVGNVAYSVPFTGTMHLLAGGQTRR